MKWLRRWLRRWRTARTGVHYGSMAAREQMRREFERWNRGRG